MEVCVEIFSHILDDTYYIVLMKPIMEMPWHCLMFILLHYSSEYFLHFCQTFGTQLRQWNSHRVCSVPSSISSGGFMQSNRPEFLRYYRKSFFTRGYV